MADSDPVVTLEQVTVSYGGQAALRDVTATGPAGAVGLLGPNGAGKSTMLKALLGFIVPDRGRMRVLGLDVAGAPLRSWWVVSPRPNARHANAWGRRESCLLWPGR